MYKCVICGLPLIEEICVGADDDAETVHVVGEELLSHLTDPARNPDKNGDEGAHENCWVALNELLIAEPTANFTWVAERERLVRAPNKPKRLTRYERILRASNFTPRTEVIGLPPECGGSSVKKQAFTGPTTTTNPQGSPSRVKLDELRCVLSDALCAVLDECHAVGLEPDLGGLIAAHDALGEYLDRYFDEAAKPLAVSGA